MIFEHGDYAREHAFDCDVVVVGTGAGGATAGAELAEAGYDVVFVEEGSWHPTSSFSPYASETIPRLFRDASGTVIMGTPPIPYIEGRCVGGSTVLNGGMSYRAPVAVLDGWERSTGAPELGSAGMEARFQRVEQLVHSGPQLEVSVGDDNRIMALGAKKLGWKHSVNPRNQHACVGSNNCVFGCPTGAKQSTLVSMMPRAMRRGARCLTEVKVTRLLIEQGRCVGVVGQAIDPRTRRASREVVVRARAVVVAAGAVQTPALLLGHKLGRPSGQLGKNFLCHPNAKVLAVYPFEVRAWQGVSQYAQVREFSDDGILMAENFIPPGALGVHLPYCGSRAWELMRRYNQMVLTGVLVEDSRPGRVTRGPFGMAVPRYDITALDHRRFLRGVKLLARLHFEMGAEEVILPFSTFHTARSIDDLEKIEVSALPPKVLDLFTVHLMGTAAMGTRAEASVTNLSGELWDLPGCYVADASLFPTAIGVNPQVTIMALAMLVAERLADTLAKSGKVAKAAVA